jgi:hypothetical protein
MTSGGTGRDLGVLLASRVPIVVIETRDELRTRQMILGIAHATQPPAAVFEWVVTEGLRRADIDMGGPQRFNMAPSDVLQQIRDGGLPGIYVLLDFHPYLSEPLNIRLLRDIGQGYDENPRNVVLLSPELTVPEELEHLTARFALSFPSREERRAIIDEVAGEWSRANNGFVAADEASITLLVENLAGLSVSDTRRLARTAVYNDGAITPSDVRAVLDAKYELLNRGGVLSFEHDRSPPSDLAGMAGLKKWLGRRVPAFDGSAPELDRPKGVLLLGVQGCGKSLAAKVAAGVFGVPLLRLDLAAVHDKYVGES